MVDDTDFIRTKVARKRELTPEIAEFALEPVNGETLPAFAAGAHITVRTPAGPMRRYSLIGADDVAPSRYVIASFATLRPCLLLPEVGRAQGNRTAAHLRRSAAVRGLADARAVPGAVLPRPCPLVAGNARLRRLR
jgi:hypothetical protein